MPDNKKMHDDLDRGREDKDFGRQTPGRNPKDDQSAGQQGGKKGNEGRQEDDEVDIGRKNR